MDAKAKTADPSLVSAAFERACDLAAAAGIPRALLAGITCEAHDRPRSAAGGHGIGIGTAIGPAYQLPPGPGVDLLEVMIHELGHCLLRAGTNYASSPTGPIPPPVPALAPALLRAEVLWNEPWERNNHGRLVLHLTEIGELPAYKTRAELDLWWVAAQKHSQLCQGYRTISPMTAYGATNSDEDFAESFVRWVTGLSMSPVARARMDGWFAEAFT